nr:RHS repeat domain-containing protein [Chthonomonas calidirosea]
MFYLTRTYDADNRLAQESHNGSVVVTYTYDGTGEKGLLTSVTNASGRTITYTYTARDEVARISEAAGTTSYSLRCRWQPRYGDSSQRGKHKPHLRCR